ncbi:MULTISPECIES: transporter substrate-binding domain-containing protein [Rhodomicrobium]|uniref:transporter substrate-binding protein n=1 Tax=Rhodomicrobium TaxID=1068 RepID=UPI000B4B43BB
MGKSVTIGILFSTSGPYAAIGRDCRDGADLALAELAADPSAPVRFDAIHADPQGDPRRYLDEARAMLGEAGCRQIVGTITSIARKEVIPLIEKHDGLLWYVCPYEGFEANESVIYTGACPNQHLIPLFDYLMPRQGKRAFLIGANYVWGWEMNRLARDLLLEAGGEVVGERCLPLEETDVERLIGEIRERRPDFILNNLIGPASYAFLRAYHALGERDRAFHPERRPVVSCDLTECELGAVGDGIAAGNLSAASYFDTLDLRENVAFKARVAAAFGAGRRVSAFFEASYTTVHMLAAAIAETGSDDPAAVKAAVHGRGFDTPHGPLRIDPRTNHAALPFHLGRITADGGFDIVASRPAMAADPYLTARMKGGRGNLRVVS